MPRSDTPSSDISLFKHAFCWEFDSKIEELSIIVQDECWNYSSITSPFPRPILRNYILNTFERLKQLYDEEPDNNHKNKWIYEDDNVSIFDTGLFTDNYERVFAFFHVNRKPDREPWYLVGFRKESERDIAGYQLPQRAKYFDTSSELVFDYTKRIIFQADHILNENIERLPQPLREDQLQARNVISGAINETIKRLAANYRLAIPQFYVKYKKMQLLIPLKLITSERPADGALIIERITPGDLNSDYRGATFIPLDWAYNNARLIAKPETDWLRPDFI